RVPYIFSENQTIIIAQELDVTLRDCSAMSEDFVEIFEHRKTNCSAHFWQFAVDPPTVLCNPMFEPEIEGYSQCFSPAEPGPNGPAFANRKRLCCVQREDFERVFIEHGCSLSA